MNPLLVLVTTAALGVEVGWEPLPDGGHEYTIQIEPQLLGVLERGTEEIFSEVPPELNVRRYRIKVGTGQLPRNVGRPAASFPAQPGDARSAENELDDSPPAWANDSDALPGSENEQPTDEAPSPHPFPSPSDRAAPGEPDVGEVNPGATPPEEREPDVPGADVPIDHASDEPSIAQPGKLPPDGEASEPIEQAGFNAPPGGSAGGAEVQTQKPQLPAGGGRPWAVLVGSIVLLCCSLGANAYLGWIAWDARQRYRGAVAKLRTAS